jgi:hypothetical protein
MPDNEAQVKLTDIRCQHRTGRYSADWPRVPRGPVYSPSHAVFGEIEVEKFEDFLNHGTVRNDSVFRDDDNAIPDVKVAAVAVQIFNSLLVEQADV